MEARGRGCAPWLTGCLPGELMGSILVAMKQPEDPPGSVPFRRTAVHAQWLRDEADRLAVLTDAAQVGHGFGWLGPDGRLSDDMVQTWIACRMTHVAGLAVLAGLPGTTGRSGPIDQEAILAHGVASLAGPLADAEHGGWFSQVGPEGPRQDGKFAYDHAFVVLAASTAVAADATGAGDLLERALTTMDEKFWDPGPAMMVESWDRGFRTLDDYRGANSNMHWVEALLAAADVTGDRGLADRAARIAGRIVSVAGSNDWRIPEHYDAHWRPQLHHNRDRRADQFQPYGATVGHGFEWARLLVQLGTAAGQQAEHTQAAVSLYDRAAADGWSVDGADGFVYTTDWDGAAVTRTRMHWVCCEAIAAAATLAEVTGDRRFEVDYERWWDYARHHLLDLDRGSWHHELDVHNRPAWTVWPGKPDVYHAVQACLLPTRPLVPSAVAAARLTST